MQPATYEAFGLTVIEVRPNKCSADVPTSSGGSCRCCADMPNSKGGSCSRSICALQVAATQHLCGQPLGSPASCLLAALVDFESRTPGTCLSAVLSL